MDDVVQPSGNLLIHSTIGRFESNLATSSQHLKQLQESHSVMVAGGRNESRAVEVYDLTQHVTVYDQALK